MPDEPETIRTSLIELPWGNSRRKLNVAVEAFDQERGTHYLTYSEIKPTNYNNTNTIFRPADTAESISIAGGIIGNGGDRRFLEHPGLFLGLAYISESGIYVNPPFTDKKVPEKKLSDLLCISESKRINQGVVRLSPDSNFGYAPFRSFNFGIQNRRDFFNSGLSRVLAHSFKDSVDLMRILDFQIYQDVNAVGFIYTPEMPALGSMNNEEPLAYLSTIHFKSEEYDGGRKVFEIIERAGDLGGFAFGVVC